MLNPLSQCFNTESARRLVELTTASVVIKRVEYLASQANEGLLTTADQQEYEAYVPANSLITIIKLKARRHLADHVAP